MAEPEKQEVQVLQLKEPSSSLGEPLRSDDLAERDSTVTKILHADGTVDLVDTYALGGDLAEMPHGYFRSLQFIGTLAAVCFSSICAYLGWVLPANTLSLINQDLGPSPNITWVATVWIMGSSIGFLLVGRLSDIFGRRWMMIACAVLGIVGCVIGACAQSIGALVASNACNGVAAAGQLSFGMVIGELVPNRHRGPVTSLVFLSNLPFAVFGPVIARLFIRNTSSHWRWSYYLGVIFGGLALVLFWTCYHPPTFGQLHVRGRKMAMVRQMDFVGIFLYAAGCALFLVGLSWGGVTYPWASPQTLCALLFGIGTLVAFVVYEGRFCSVQPLMPPRMFRNIGFNAIIMIATIGAMVYYALTVLWPTIIGTMYTTDSISIGLQSSVVGGGVLLGQAIAGFCLSYVPKVKFQCIAAACITFAFFTAMISISPDRWAATIAMGTLGCTAIGFIDNIAFPGVTLVWEPQDIGLATGVLGSIRGLGGAVAQALYVSVLNNELNMYIPELVGPAATDAGLPLASLPGLLEGISEGNFTRVPGMNAAIAAAVEEPLKTAYTESFKVVFYATIPFSVLLIGGACFVPNMEGLLGYNVAKRLQGKRSQRPSHKDTA